MHEYFRIKCILLFELIFYKYNNLDRLLEGFIYCRAHTLKYKTDHTRYAVNKFYLFILFLFMS